MPMYTKGPPPITIEQVLEEAKTPIRPIEYLPWFDSNVIKTLLYSLLGTIERVFRGLPPQEVRCLRSDKGIYVVPFFSENPNRIHGSNGSYSFALIGEQKSVPVMICVVTVKCDTFAQYPHIYLPRKKKWKCDLDQWLRSALLSSKWECVKP